MAGRNSVLSSFERLQSRDSARDDGRFHVGEVQKVLNLLRPPDALYLRIKEPERETYLSSLPTA